MQDSGSVYIFVEDEEQLDKVLEVRARLPLLRKIIVFDMEGLRDLDDSQVMSLDAVARARAGARSGQRAARGRMGAAHRQPFARRIWRS